MFLPVPDLRISDADREAASDFLKRHYAAGRLSEDELSARVDAVYRARSESQLVRLTQDLPYLPEPVSPPARRLPRVGPPATAVAAAVLFVVVAAGLPADVWAPLVALGLPIILMLLFTLAPLAVPVLGFLWIARLMAGPRRLEQPPRRW